MHHGGSVIARGRTAAQDAKPQSARFIAPQICNYIPPGVFIDTHNLLDVRGFLALVLSPSDRGGRLLLPILFDTFHLDTKQMIHSAIAANVCMTFLKKAVALNFSMRER